ncbi:hypothetical protein Trydic_g18767 [Trypoxylus dichotomus]
MNTAGPYYRKNVILSNSRRQLAAGRPLFMILEEKDDHLDNRERTPRTFSNQGSIICDKTAPKEPADFKYEELVDLMNQHYNTEPLEIAENFKFHMRKQQEGETINDFISALRMLVIHYKFGRYLETALRNQLVFGLRSGNIQGRLFECKKLTLENVLVTATNMEMSAISTAAVKNENVHTIHTQ